MNSYIVALLLVAAPLAFAAFLLFFMMSGKGTKPMEKEDDANHEAQKKVNTNDDL